MSYLAALTLSLTVLSAPSEVTVQDFERLHLDLAGKALTTEERSKISEDLAKAKDPMKVYAAEVDRLLDKKSLKRALSGFWAYLFPELMNLTAEVFFHRLSKFEGGAEPIYYLPHSIGLEPGQAASKAPCEGAEVVSVSTWWQKKPIKICKQSHLPEKIFDEVGYCAGETEPVMRNPPRPGCGCGPMLMGCLPPHGEHPKLEKQVATAVHDEWYETAGRIVDENRPLDLLVTTTDTWQSGLIRFLYARRDVLAMLANKKWTPKIQKKIEARFKKIDINAAPKMVKRSKVYQGTGLWWTSHAPHSMKFPLRVGAHATLISFLCSDFHAVNVDAEAVLQAVKDDTKNLRTLSAISDSPMKTQKGCDGCHAPMDGAVGFMTELQASGYGSYPTGLKGKGEFYVSGASDKRGTGSGIATLAKLIVAQPEFETCSVTRAFKAVFFRMPRASERPMFAELVSEFDKNGHRWKPILRKLYLSTSYLSPEKGPELQLTAAPATEVPKLVSEMVAANCVECHDDTHDSLDLRTLPPIDQVQVWRDILHRVADQSMPPPKEDANLEKRFPLTPQSRRHFTKALTVMLGPAADKPTPPKRILHYAWAGMVNRFAADVIGKEKVQALLTANVGRDGIRVKQPPLGLPPPYLLAAYRGSEDVCREVMAKEISSGGKYFDIKDTGDDAALQAGVTKMLTKISGQADPPKVAAAVDLLKRMHETTKDWQEAWTGLCSTELTSPDMLFKAHPIL